MSDVAPMADANDIRLSPCPFCGAEAELNTATNDHTWWTLGCPNIACEISPQTQSQDRDGMIGAWNRRVYVTETQS
jgi:hypothetical protein